MANRASNAQAAMGRMVRELMVMLLCGVLHPQPARPATRAERKGWRGAEHYRVITARENCASSWPCGAIRLILSEETFEARRVSRCRAGQRQVNRASERCTCC